MNHTLTPTQQTVVKTLVDSATELKRQHSEIEQRLNWFLSYVVAENELPDTTYSLSPDGTQLIGAATRQEDNTNG